MLESDIVGTCLKKEGGLEGRDQAEDPFHDSRKKTRLSPVGTGRKGQMSVAEWGQTLWELASG